jgi:hypothetical protein
MFQVKIAVRRLTAVAAAALSVACTGDEVLNQEGTSPSLADTPARTPLVDDDGWPMPADPPAADTSHAAAAQQCVAR